MLSVPRNSGRSPLWRQPIAALTILVLCVTLVVGLAWLVLHEIETLTSSNSDNLQWSLAQAEVDFLRYEAALVQAEASIGEDDADTTDAAIVALRRAFDIFYSRMTLIEEASAFRVMQDNQDFNTPRQRVDAFLQETVPLIDGSEPALLAAIPDLRVRRSHPPGRAVLLAVGPRWLCADHRCPPSQPDPHPRPDRHGAFPVHRRAVAAGTGAGAHGASVPRQRQQKPRPMPRGCIPSSKPLWMPWW